LCDHSPLVLDLDGNGIRLSSPEHGVRFDLRAVGAKIRTAWPRGDDALLVLDRDGDGRITNGAELFGNSIHAPERYPHGFASLAEFDGNGDEVIDEKDAVFYRLRLWKDRNRNGSSERSELATLSQAGVVALPLAYALSGKVDRFGNKWKQVGSFERVSSDGSRTSGSMVDVWFRLAPDRGGVLKPGS
jgi:hypothetical protein